MGSSELDWVWFLVAFRCWFWVRVRCDAAGRLAGSWGLVWRRLGGRGKKEGKKMKKEGNVVGLGRLENGEEKRGRKERKKEEEGEEEKKMEKKEKEKEGKGLSGPWA